MIGKIATAGDPLGKEAKQRLTEIEKLFTPKKTVKSKKAAVKLKEVTG
jgi:hypothetical protein